MDSMQKRNLSPRTIENIRAYQREYYRKNREILKVRSAASRRRRQRELSVSSLKRYYAASDEEKQRLKARGKVHDAIRYGKLIKGACAICGQIKAEAHHDNYNEPFKITWLCTPHHKAWHRVFNV